MTKISYGDKTAVEPQVSHATQWWADDANDVKDTVNANDTVATSTSAIIVFDQVTGYTHGTFGTPITGTITLDDSSDTEGSCAVMIWSGSSTPTFSGGTIQSMSGDITESGTYSIYFHYLNGRININVFNVTGSVDVTAPVMLSATIENSAPTNLVMVFSEAVTGTNLGFTIAGTTSTSFSSISGSGTITITGVLGTAAANGETITLDYSSGTGDLEDSSGNALATFTGAAVTNNVSAATTYGIKTLFTSGSSLLESVVKTATTNWTLEFNVNETAAFPTGKYVFTNNKGSTTDGFWGFYATAQYKMLFRIWDSAGAVIGTEMTLTDDDKITVVKTGDDFVISVNDIEHETISIVGTYTLNNNKLSIGKSKTTSAQNFSLYNLSYLGETFAFDEQSGLTATGSLGSVLDLTIGTGTEGDMWIVI